MRQPQVRLNLSRHSRSLIPDLKTLSRYEGRALVSHRIIIFKEQEKMFRLFLMIIITFLFSYFASAKSSVNFSGGDMRFYGSVVNAPCSIEAQSLHQSVMMDQVRAADFPSRGSWSEPKTFGLSLITAITSFFILPQSLLRAQSIRMTRRFLKLVLGLIQPKAWGSVFSTVRES